MECKQRPAFHNAKVMGQTELDDNMFEGTMLHTMDQKQPNAGRASIQDQSANNLSTLALKLQIEENNKKIKSLTKFSDEIMEARTNGLKRPYSTKQIIMWLEYLFTLSFLIASTVYDF